MHVTDFVHFTAPLRHELLGDLTDCGEFTIQDLEHNRKGRLSSMQMLLLLTRSLRPLWAALGVTMLWLLFMAVLATFSVDLVSGLWLYDFMGVPMAVAPALLAALLTALLHVNGTGFALLLDVIRGRCSCIEGHLVALREERPAEGFNSLSYKTVPCYLFCLPGMRFEVSREAYEVLAIKYDSARPHVKLHYAPRSKAFLSVEPI